MNINTTGGNIFNSSIEAVYGGFDAIQNQIKQLETEKNALMSQISCYFNPICWIESITHNFLKQAAYNFPNSVASLPGLGFSLVKRGLYAYLCPNQDSAVCDTARQTGRQVQNLAISTFNSLAQSATDALVPAKEAAYESHNISNKIQHFPEIEKFNVVNIIAPAIFAGFCTRKSMENLNNCLYHAYLLGSFKRNQIETATGGHTYIDNRSTMELVWAVALQAGLAAAWGFGSYITAEAIEDALKNAGVPNAAVTARAFVLSAYVAPKIWRWMSDALFANSENQPAHFDNGTTMPKTTKLAIADLDPTGKLHSYLDPYIATVTSLNLIGARDD